MSLKMQKMFQSDDSLNDPMGDYLQKGPHIIVNLIKGENLASRDLNGKSDPFVVVKVGKSEAKGKKIMKTLNPQWNESLTLKVTTEFLEITKNPQIELTCWDYNTFKKPSFLGLTTVRIAELENDVPKSFQKNLDQVESGTIFFNITARKFPSIKELTQENTKKAIIGKLSQHPKFADFQKSPDKRKRKVFEQTVENLSDVGKFQKEYLSTDWVSTLKIQQQINKEFSNEEDLEFEEIDDEEEEGNLERIIEEEIMNSDVVHRFQKNVKVKIVFVDQGTDFQKEIRKILSPIITDLKISRLGMFHTALIIGPWYLEWNDASLCIPRKCTSSYAFLTTDVGEIETKESIQDLSKKLAEIIVDWNSNVTYSQNERKNHGNCQTFVESILNNLNMKFKPTGVLSRFIENIKKTGSSKLMFPISKQFKSNFKLKIDSIEFKSHSDLDKFVRDLRKTDPEFDVKFNNESSLLKAFDRAFWLKYQNCKKDLMTQGSLLKILQGKDEQNDEDLKSMKEIKERVASVTVVSKEMEPLDIGCPFGDPSETNSIRF
eukprot:gene11124-3943_t